MVPLRTFNIWRTFLFHKRFFVAKEGSPDYKKVRKRWLFKEPLTEWFFVEPKLVLLWHRCEEPFEATLFLRVIPLLNWIVVFIYLRYNLLITELLLSTVIIVSLIFLNLIKFWILCLVLKLLYALTFSHIFLLKWGTREKKEQNCHRSGTLSKCAL